MNVTTVKLQKRTKSFLDELRGEGETYDALIGRLALQARHRDLKRQLEDAYKSLGRKDIELLEEWETASLEA